MAFRQNIRTVSLALTDAYQKGSEMLDAISDFDGESRFWRDVEVRSLDAASRIALTGGVAPSTDAASVGVDADGVQVFASLDFDSAWFRAGAFGDEQDPGSGSEEGSLLEITGTPSSYDAVS